MTTFRSGSTLTLQHFHGNIQVTVPEGGTVKDLHRELLRHVQNEAPAHQTPMIPSVRTGVLMGTA